VNSDTATLDRPGIERWLVEEFASGLASAVEAMAGARPAVKCSPQSSAPPAGGLLWRQPMASLSGAVVVSVEETSWSAIGFHILSAAGVEETDLAERKATCLEVLRQALSAMARSLAERLRREVTCTDGSDGAELLSGGSWAALETTLGETPAQVDFGIEPALLDSLELALAPTALTRDTPVQGVPHGSRTFDLLLDVELPVSVSFGHAQVLLKDVLKLTTGSIVELNRAIVEPVDIVVNNCVIARGEVVVVEGNFGVRIQHVVSREERVRTIQ
jgi:flagellar motor switch protein FliN/FliY